MHSRHAGIQRRRAQKVQQEDNKVAFTLLATSAAPADERRMHRAKETGTWLTTTPNHLNGTVLSADEF